MREIAFNDKKLPQCAEEAKYYQYLERGRVGCLYMVNGLSVYARNINDVIWRRLSGNPPDSATEIDFKTAEMILSSWQQILNINN